jgi:leucyl-tRNA synthetase
MYKKGLLYEKQMPMNWCPKCRIVAANEEVEDGKHERCGTEVEKRNLTQWMFRITDYAERLLQDLDELTEWPEKIIAMQKNWIGKSEGAEVQFPITNEKLQISVYTTRIDTLFSGTFLILSPEHELVQKITTPEQKGEVDAYCKHCAAMSDLERTELNKEKTVFLRVLMGSIPQRETRCRSGSRILFWQVTEPGRFLPMPMMNGILRWQKSITSP